MEKLALMVVVVAGIYITVRLARWYIEHRRIKTKLRERLASVRAGR